MSRYSRLEAVKKALLKMQKVEELISGSEKKAVEEQVEETAAEEVSAEPEKKTKKKVVKKA